MRRGSLEPLASRKVVWGDQFTEGSETTKSGTDEQEPYKRHVCLGKQPHHCNAQKSTKGAVKWIRQQLSER
jgi:hypothetical protein